MHPVKPTRVSPAEPGAYQHLVKGLQGVSRIALVGSLTTPKREPKDADVLVTVYKDVDLAYLAARGRKLKGACQSRSKGADIFLCNVSEEYIGRTCSWKVCHMRAACTGNSCGNGSYLCDDLDIVCLGSRLVKKPPIELWPNMVRRVQVPVDVEEHLLGLLTMTEINEG